MKLDRFKNFEIELILHDLLIDVMERTKCSLDDAEIFIKYKIEQIKEKIEQEALKHENNA